MRAAFPVLHEVRRSDELLLQAAKHQANVGRLRHSQAPGSQRRLRQENRSYETAMNRLAALPALQHRLVGQEVSILLPWQEHSDSIFSVSTSVLEEQQVLEQMQPLVGDLLQLVLGSLRSWGRTVYHLLIDVSYLGLLNLCNCACADWLCACLRADYSEELRRSELCVERRSIPWQLPELADASAAEAYIDNWRKYPSGSLS